MTKFVGRPVIPILIEQLKERDLSTVDANSETISFATITYILAALGPEARESIPVLEEMARDAQAAPVTRYAAVTALISVTPEDQPVSPFVVDVLKSGLDEFQQAYESNYENKRALEASIGMGVFIYSRMLIQSGHTKCEVPGLVEIAQGDFPAEIRAAVIGVLGELSFDAKAAVPELRKLLTDEDPLIRTCAVSAILSIEDDESLIPELMPLLKLDETERAEFEQSFREHFEYQRKQQAGWSEMKLDDDLGRWMLADIRGTLQHGSGFQKRQTIQMLGHIGPNAKPALPELRQALKDPDEDTRRMAAEAIRAIEE